MGRGTNKVENHWSKITECALKAVRLDQWFLNWVRCI